MNIRQDHLRRKVVQLIANFGPAERPEVLFRDGAYDAVVDVALIQIGACRDDDMRGPAERARKLFGAWLVELVNGDTKYTSYGEAVANVIGALVGSTEITQDKLTIIEGERPEFCAWCNKHQVSGETRAQVAAKQGERESIERELGLR